MQSSLPLNDQVKRTIALIISSGYQLDPEGLVYLRNLAKDKKIEDWIKTVINSLSDLDEKPLFITKKILAENVDNTPTTETSVHGIASVGEPFRAYAREIKSEIEVLEDVVTTNSLPRPLDNFLELFKDRFNKIEKILKKRLDARDAVSINVALESSQKAKVKTIGIVMEKREKG